MEGQSLGDVFNQRRTARQQQEQEKKKQQQQQLSSDKSHTNVSGIKRTPSFLEIQQEQQQEQQLSQVRNQSRRGGGGNSFVKNNDVHFGGSSNNRDYHKERSPRRTSSHHTLKDLADFPLEQGKVQTLLENFGFIYCADRPGEIFFHYSEFMGNSDNLNVGDEVEFRVGPAANPKGGNNKGGEEKLSAYAVKSLEDGTIEWEVEVDPVGVRRRGKVDRVIKVGGRERGRSNNNQMNEGTIRQNTNDGENKKESLIRFSASDYAISSYSRNEASSGGRLIHNDVVEFTLVKDKRTGHKYARSITLIQSERERLEEERERKLMESATLEQGVVVSLKENFGFLRSNKRMEEVYFSYSHIILPEGGDEEHNLAEGQDMEFLVVSELDVGRRGGGNKLSARQLKFLDRGTVIFQQTLANRVEGVIVECPHPLPQNSKSSGNRSKRNNNISEFSAGKILLNSPITYTPIESPDSSPLQISEVIFDAVYSPGGSFSTGRDGSRLSLWVREGDSLLFDVVRNIVDGSCHILPTEYFPPSIDDVPKVEAGKELTQADTHGKLGTIPKVHFLSPSLAGRAEGVINSIKDNYGFIQLAERNVDAYFRLNDVFPPDIIKDLARNDSTIEIIGNDKSGNKIEKLVVGAEVSFDLSLQPNQGNSYVGRNRSNRQQNERESLRAQRLAILKPSSIMKDKLVALGVKGVVTKDDPNQPGVGQIELHVGVKGMSQSERHPIIANLLDSVLSGKCSSPTTFHEAQSEKENVVIKEMVNAKGGLDISYVPVPAGDYNQSHPGRIQISKMVDKGSLSCTDVLNNNENTSESKLISNSSNMSAEMIESDKVSVLLWKEASEEEAHVKKKKPKKKMKSVRSIRFDKYSFPSNIDGGPPLKGDIIQCDVIQSRHNGSFSVVNIHILERKMFERGLEPGDFVADGVNQHVTTQTDTNLNSPNEISSKTNKNICQGYILMEPSHTSLSNTPSHASHGNPHVTGTEGGRWGNCIKEVKGKTSDGINTKEDGCIMLLSEPPKRSRKNSNVDLMAKSQSPLSDSGDHIEPGIEESTIPIEKTINESIGSVGDASGLSSSLSFDERIVVGSKLLYNISSIAGRGNATASFVTDGTNAGYPKRGDLVSFVKGKGGKVRDIRVLKRGAANAVKGNLSRVNIIEGKATFTDSTKSHDTFEISLSEVISCDVSVLKEKDSVEGILHDGKIFGVCRTADLYLVSKLGNVRKQRPRLNLTVKKELRDLGGKIIAQSGMAKGPDGSNGFTPGWTIRLSKFAIKTSEVTPENDEEENCASEEKDAIEEFPEEVQN